MHGSEKRRHLLGQCELDDLDAGRDTPTRLAEEVPVQDGVRQDEELDLRLDQAQEVELREEGLDDAGARAAVYSCAVRLHSSDQRPIDGNHIELVPAAADEL